MSSSSKGDFSRLRFEPKKNYSSVRLQQGRPLLDADWNEQGDIVAHRLRTQIRDLAGESAAPGDAAGFEIRAVGALAFDGKRTFATMGGPDAEFDFSRGIMLEAWVRPASGQHGESGTLLSGCRYRSDGTVEPLVALEIRDDGTVWLRVADPDEEATADEDRVSVQSSRSLGADRFHHVAAVVGSERTSLYVDGEVAEGRGVALPAGAFLFVVGAAEGAEEQRHGFHGAIRELRLWKGAETQPGLSAEVGEAADVDDLVGHWELGGVENGLVPDLRGGPGGDLRLGGDDDVLPRLVIADIEIGAGRYYAAGNLCEHEEPVLYSEQPVPPAGGLPVQSSPGSRYLFYLDAWERSVSALQDPDLVEVALGGLDTTVRNQVVAQVRWRPVAGESDEASVAEACRFQSPPRGLLRATRGSSASTLDDRLYRLEIHTGGRARGSTRTEGDSFEVTSVGVGAEVDTGLRLLVSADEPPSDLDVWRPGDWVELHDADAGSENGPLGRLENVDREEGELEIWLPGGEQVAPGSSLRRTATYKWSKSNASVALRLVSAEGSSAEGSGSAAGQTAEVDADDGGGGSTGAAAPTASGELTVVSFEDPAGAAGEFRDGKWVEIVEGRDSPSSASRPLLAIKDISDGGERRTLVLEGRLALSEDEAGSLRPIVVQWDHDSGAGLELVADGTLVLEAGKDTPLGEGIRVLASEGVYQPGDFWLIPSRSSTNSLLWPRNESGEPRFRAADGIEHHVSPLAVLTFTEEGFELEDRRRTFKPAASGPVSKEGDEMSGPLTIRPSEPDEIGLEVVGDGAFTRIHGNLATPGSVESRNIADHAITSAKMASDAGIVPAGFALLGAPQATAPGYAPTGAELTCFAESPEWTERHRERVGGDASVVAAAAIGRSIFAATADGRLWHYDVDAGAMDQAGQLPGGRREFAMASLGDSLYVLGGVNAGGAPDASTYAFDTGTRGWDRKADLPVARRRLAVAVVDGALFALGGLRKALFIEFSSRRVDVYDPRADRWDRSRSMPVGRHDLAAAGLPGSLFAVGGERAWWPRWLGGGMSARCDELVPGIGRWRAATSMPTPRSVGTAVAVSGRICLVGGKSLFGALRPTLEYDIATRTWRTLAALSDPHARVGVVTIDGSVFGVAGEQEGVLRVDRLEVGTTFRVFSKVDEATTGVAHAEHDLAGPPSPEDGPPLSDDFEDPAAAEHGPADELSTASG